MIRKELILQSPLRILDRSIRGGLGKGRLGVITAPAGMGKSACLVHIGLDALLRDRSVLHVSVGHSVEHVAAWYDAAFDELAARADLSDRGGVREAIAHRRLIWSFPDRTFDARGLDEALGAFRAHLALVPSVVLIDGFDWTRPGCIEVVRLLKDRAIAAQAELWMTARERGESRAAGSLGAACDACAALVDVALSLAPYGRYVRLLLLKARELPAADVPLVLDGGTLRPLREDEAGSTIELDPASFTLLASGSVGAEEEFGACAERWGVQEMNFTFAGRRDLARRRGLVELTDDELRMGEVSAAYVKAHLHRQLPETPEFARLLQAIWHQVSTAGEVFSVGSLKADKTAQGGTGWAVELARHWGKPVHLFDQERRCWFRWDGRDWAAEAPPVITQPRFAGAGTRSPSGDGRAAIHALFERSFGPPG